jgi:predicted neutral ceramidase superfamily lipid hydrolase
MNDSEFDRKMTFIVEQQAQFAADIQRLEASQAKTEKLVNRFATATFSAFTDVNTAFDDIDVKINALVNSQIELSESQKLTEEKWRNLMAVVDRYFKKRNRN